MDLSKLVPIIGQINLIPGVEGTLISGKFKKNIAGIVAIAGLLIQLLTDLLSQDDYLKKLPYYFTTFFEFIKHVFKGEWELVKNYEMVIGLTGFVLLLIALFFYLFYLVKTFLIKYSEEPFQYTFWVDRFIKVDDKPNENDEVNGKDQIVNLLHHDVMERLSERIGRLSLLDETLLEDDVKKRLSSHIFIDGHYGFWHDGDGNTTVHVMPRIRIGNPGSPKTLTYPIKFSLNKENSDNIDKFYNDIMERVYSIIATEIYKQIKSDLKKKINLFPTKYLRAVALFYEAEDFAKSNTIDAYDHAITLYKESLRYFDVSYKNLVYRLLLNIPVLRLGLNFTYIWSRTQIGYAKCLIYRRVISAHTGRHSNPIFEIPGELNKVIKILVKFHNKISRTKWSLNTLPKNKNTIDGKIINRFNATMAYLTFKKDSLWTRINIFKPKLNLFKKQIRILFDAYTVNALAHYHLDAIQKSKEYLNDAKAIAPAFSEKNALFLMVSGTIEPVIEKKISLLVQATEIAPDFEIAQYLLAHNLDIQFREEEELIKDGAKYVITEYESVLKISPGNIAALASQGYLYWLTNNLTAAKNKFKQGSEVKAVIKQTFIGELNYGLARIAAEEGRISDSYYHYTQAFAADPGIGVYTMTSTTSRVQSASFFKHIDLSILKRYENFYLNFEQGIFSLNIGDIKDLNGLILKIKDRRNQTSKYIQSLLSSSSKKKIRAHKNSAIMDEDIKTSLINELNSMIGDENFYHGQKSIKIKESYLAQMQDKNKNMKIRGINKVFLYMAYPNEFEQSINGSERFNKNREIFDVDSKKVSSQIQNRVHSFVLNDLGNAQLNFFLRFGDFEILRAAKNTYEEAALLDGKNKVIFYNLARTYEFLGNADNAIENFEEAMKLDPSWHVCTTAYIQFKLKKDHENVSMNTAYVATRGQNYKKLMEDLSEIIKRTKLSHIYEGLNIDSSNNYSLIKILEEIKIDLLDDNDVEALKLWTEILSYDYVDDSKIIETEKISTLIIERYYPDNFDINTILYRIYGHKIERMAKSGTDRININRDRCKTRIRESLVNYLEQDPINYSVLTWIKDFIDKDESKLMIGTAIKKVNNKNFIAGYYDVLGDAYMKDNYQDDAEKEYKKAIESNQNSAYHMNKLGLFYYIKEDYPKAIVYFKKASNLDAKNEIYVANIGDAYRQLKHWSDAEKAYKKALDLKPNDANFINNLGLVRYGEEVYAEAIKYFEIASNIDVKNEIYVGNIGDAYRQLKQWPEAVNAYKKALEINPENTRYINDLGLVYYHDKKYTKAIEYFEKASKLQSDNATYVGNIADAYRQLEQWPEAINAYKKALEINPENTRYINDLGLVYYDDKKYTKAIEYFEKASKLQPDNATHVGNIADAYRQLKKWPEAINAYKKALEINPENTRYINGLGLAYGSDKKYTKAIEYFEKASKLQPDNATSMGNIADAYRQLKKWPEAINAYKKALEINPENTRYINDLGRVYYHDKKYTKAKEYFEKASKLQPDDATYVGNIADAYRLLNRWGEAENTYKKALLLHPDSSLYLNNLGLVFLNKKEYPKAISLFEKAAILDPDNDIYLKNIEFTKNQQKVS